MSRAVWRATFGILRGNPLLPALLALCSFATELPIWQAFGNDFPRNLHMDATLKPFFVLMVWVLFGVGWPAASSMFPSFRQVLQLPLAAREAGAVLLLLRVGAPAAALMSTALLFCAAQFAATGAVPDHAVLSTSFTLGMCAAFPALMLVPFLPLPASMSGEAAGGTPFGTGGRRSQMLAAAALLVGGPALAALPAVALATYGAAGLAAPIALGLALVAIAWQRREQVVIAAFRSDRRRAAALPPGARGWPSVAPLLALPLLATLGAGIAVALAPPGVRGAALGNLAAGMVALLSASIGFVWLAPLLASTRVLRLLPLRQSMLSGVFFATALLPQALCFIVAATWIVAARPAVHLPVAHTACLWLTCCALDALCVAPMVRLGRRRATFLVTFPLLAVQWSITNASFLIPIPTPPDTWLLACSAGLLALSYVWLTRTLRTAPALATGIA